VDRAQTVQDFALGMSVFLLAVAFVFAFVPSLTGPIWEGATATEVAQADRAAATLLETLSTDGAGNAINGTAAAVAFQSTLSGGRAADTLGLAEPVGVNVTVLSADRETTLTTRTPAGTDVALAGGEPYREQSAATVTRTVAADSAGGGCDPACYVVLRVW
jgi:hypothetical protein